MAGRKRAALLAVLITVGALASCSVGFEAQSRVPDARVTAEVQEDALAEHGAAYFAFGDFGSLVAGSDS